MKTTLRSAALGAGRVRAIPARSIATSSPRKADHSHDSHSHGHNDISDAVTHESECGSAFTFKSRGDSEYGGWAELEWRSQISENRIDL